MHGPWIGLVVELLHSAFVQYPCVDAALFLSCCCLLALSLSLAFFVSLLRCQVSLSCIVLKKFVRFFFCAASSCQFSGHQLRILQFTFCPVWTFWHSWWMKCWPKDKASCEMHQPHTAEGTQTKLGDVKITEGVRHACWKSNEVTQGLLKCCVPSVGEDSFVASTLLQPHR